MIGPHGESQEHVTNSLGGGPVLAPMCMYSNERLLHYSKFGKYMLHHVKRCKDFVEAMRPMPSVTMIYWQSGRLQVLSRLGQKRGGWRKERTA